MTNPSDTTTGKKKMKKNEYQCEHCKGIFIYGWSDKEAKKEAEDLWGDDIGENPAIVCDDCFKFMINEISPVDWRKNKKGV